MINIASLYYFTLLQRLSPKHKESLNMIIWSIHQYLREESLDFTIQKKSLWGYKLISFIIDGIWNIYLYQKNKKEKQFYYYPSFFSDIYIEKIFLENDESIKKIIFFLSNIFECFDRFDEKNILIEFHKDIEETYNHKKKYQLRYDFININSLSHIYDENISSKEIKNFIETNTKIWNMSTIKNRFPHIYRMLLFFVYNIFILQKNFISTDKELSKIQEFENKNADNIGFSISTERLKINRKSLKRTLAVYKSNFEKFLIIIKK